MNLKKLAAGLAVACAVAAATPASAVVLTSSSLAPGNTVTDISAAGVVSFDLFLQRPSEPTVLTFTIEAGDLGGPLAFDAIVSNQSLFGINDFKLFIDNASFAVPGTAHGFGGFGDVQGGASGAGILFDPSEFADFFIGDPVGTAGALDWQISIAGLDVGDTFTLTMQAPAPATLSLLLASLGIAGFVRRRRNHAGQ